MSGTSSTILLLLAQVPGGYVCAIRAVQLGWRLLVSRSVRLWVEHVWMSVYSVQGTVVGLWKYHEAKDELGKMGIKVSEWNWSGGHWWGIKNAVIFEYQGIEFCSRKQGRLVEGRGQSCCCWTSWCGRVVYQAKILWLRPVWCCFATRHYFGWKTHCVLDRGVGIVRSS